MGLLCFVLDLPSLQPLLLNDVKRQSLLRVANLCSLRKLKCAQSMADRSVNLALCSVDRSSVSDKYELRIIYRSADALNLREFHHAVSSLTPSSAVNLPGASGCVGQVSSLGTIIKEKALFSLAPQQNCKKVIMISGHYSESIESCRGTLLEAADHCVSVDFIEILHQEPDRSSVENSLSDMDSLPQFAVNIGEFENCAFQQVPWDVWNFASLEKKWAQDLISDIECPLEATLLFREKLYKDVERVFCSVLPMMIQLADTIQPCQMCRCHGAVVGTSATEESGKTGTCPITKQELDIHDLSYNGVEIGLSTVLYLPSFKGPFEQQKSLNLARPNLTFTVIKCIALNTLSEGLLFGDPYNLVPSSEIDWEGDEDKLEVNDWVFATLCDVLYSKDSGLLCTSTTDIDTLMDKSFPCYYLLLPAESKSMMARRIAASEELLRISPPELKHANIPVEFKDSINKCLIKIGVENYNPLSYERGCHAKLTWLVKESLQFRYRPMPDQRALAAKQVVLKQTSLNKRTSALHNETLHGSSGKICTPDKVQTVQNTGQIELRSPMSLTERPSLISSPSIHGSTPMMSPQSVKPLLPLQTCPRQIQNQVKPTHLQFLEQPTVDSRRPKTQEPPPTLLKANFRRIRHGKL